MKILIKYFRVIRCECVNSLRELNAKTPINTLSKYQYRMKNMF